MKGRGGRIINLASAEGVMGSPISAGYAAAKAGVHAWTRSAAKVWRTENITVNALAPAMDTRGARSSAPTRRRFSKVSYKRAFPSTANSAVRPAIWGRSWCSWPVMAPTSSPASFWPSTAA